MPERVMSILRKYTAPVLADVFCVVLCFYVAMVLRFASEVSAMQVVHWEQFRQYILPVAAIYCLCNMLFGLYSRIWSYASSDEVVSVVESVSTATLLLLAVDLLWPGARPLPLSVALTGGLFTLVAFAAVRYRSRVLRGFLLRWRSRAAQYATRTGTRVLLVGAGEAGQLLAWRLLHEAWGEGYLVVGFVDDDPRKQGMIIHGLKVLGDRADIPAVVREEGVELIIIAIHTIANKDFRDLLAICQTTSAGIKTLPNVIENLQGMSDAALLRDITVQDLLGRETVSISREACHELIGGRVLLVTGAAGSIGSELCRQIAPYQPRLLLMLDNNETGLFELSLEMGEGAGSLQDDSLPSRGYIVADVTDRPQMARVLAKYRPQIVMHAAAYKHVPLMEQFPEQAIRVNIGGTLGLLELAADCGTERFVFVSTDKAVEPVCAMGASKCVGEMLVASLAADAGLVATAVRFGNVLGSRGSVVPVFQAQIDAGKPVTVTHPEATRFFMGISEAARLILQAASMARGGEVFVLEMGEPLRIADLAQRMIRLRGLRVGQDVPIVYTGLRPGERLHEKLVAAWETQVPTSHPKVFALRSNQRCDGVVLRAQVRHLLALLEQEVSSAELAQALLALARTASAPVCQTTGQGGV